MIAKYKWAILLVLGLGLVIGTALFLLKTYRAGEKAGQNKVITDVQSETIKKTDEARKDKERADEAVRDKPIDAVIDSLR